MLHESGALNGTYHDLLSLGKVIAWVAIQGQLSKWREGNQFLGNNLCGIEKIKTEAELSTLR